jgi:hypothetical protein
MAKGDHSRLQNTVDYSTNFAQNRLDNTQRILDRQNLGFEQNYNRAASTQLNDYDSMMNQYRSFLSGAPMGGNAPPSSGPGYVPPTGSGNPGSVVAPGQSLEGAPHATNPNNQPPIGTAVPRGQIGPGPGQAGAPGATQPNVQPTQNNVPTGAPANVNAANGDIGQQISAYFKSRGVADSETPYWVQKWQEFGASDPTYFNQRLAQADIFRTSQGQQTSGGAGSAEQFIANYQREHPNEVSKQGILTALQQNGFNASDFTYNGVSSGNEITLNGQKYKVLSNENSNNPSWYTAGTNDSPPAGSPGSLVNPLTGYSDFATTGGFSPRDIQNIRAQSIAPIRSIVSSGIQEVNRQGKMGNAPNKVAALAKISREGAYETADATTNAEANIARMIQSGKLAGLGGLQSGMLGAMQGMTSLYGSTPGMANTFGNQVLSSTGQELYGSSLQNDLAKIRIEGQKGVAGTAGDTAAVTGNLASILNVLSKIPAGAQAGNAIWNWLKTLGGGGGSYGGPGEEPTNYGAGFPIGFGPNGPGDPTKE